MDDDVDLNVDVGVGVGVGLGVGNGVGVGAGVMVTVTAGVNSRTTLLPRSAKNTSPWESTATRHAPNSAAVAGPLSPV